MNIKIIIPLLLIAFPTKAHTFTGMIGFYDGFLHPVIGLDHFLAMVCVGVISVQIGGNAIWRVPTLFIAMMIVGAASGLIIEVNYPIYEKNISNIIELGIIMSVVLLGLAIALDKRLQIKTTISFICLFGVCHGFAHGMEIPWSKNPVLFMLGFIFGTSILHLFGVGIGSLMLRNIFINKLLRVLGVICCSYGLYLFFLLL